jgi:hypothetical protein
MGCGCGSSGVQRTQPVNDQVRPQAAEQVRPQKIIQQKSATRPEIVPIASAAAPNIIKCPKCDSHTIRVNISGRQRIQCSNSNCRKILS